MKCNALAEIHCSLIEGLPVQRQLFEVSSHIFTESKDHSHSCSVADKLQHLLQLQQTRKLISTLCRAPRSRYLSCQGTDPIHQHGQDAYVPRCCFISATVHSNVPNPISLYPGFKPPHVKETHIFFTSSNLCPVASIAAFNSCLGSYFTLENTSAT